jgi:hypothetical protein
MANRDHLHFFFEPPFLELPCFEEPHFFELPCFEEPCFELPHFFEEPCFEEPHFEDLWLLLDLCDPQQHHIELGTMRSSRRAIRNFAAIGDAFSLELKVDEVRRLRAPNAKRPSCQIFAQDVLRRL